MDELNEDCTLKYIESICYFNRFVYCIFIFKLICCWYRVSAILFYFLFILILSVIKTVVVLLKNEEE